MECEGGEIRKGNKGGQRRTKEGAEYAPLIRHRNIWRYGIIEDSHEIVLYARKHQGVYMAASMTE
jgi:hypothetical protein